MTLEQSEGDESVPQPVNLEEYEAMAREHLPRFAYDYIAGGAESERTVERNRLAFNRYLLRPRVLAGIEQPSLQTTVLGSPIAIPIILAPTACQRLAHDDGELASVRAAASAGTACIASTLSTCSLEEIAGVAGGPLWFQLYWYRDRALTEWLVRRAAAAGYAAICLTVDTPVLGRREREIRDHFALPAHLKFANFVDSERSDMPPVADGSSLAAYIADQLDPSLTWADLRWLKSLTDLPLVIKGIMNGDDAQQAVEAGAAAIIVSNHGGRQLDSLPGTIEVLEEVVACVSGRCEVYVDGGIRRGTEVVKALALGARAVLIGRPYLWGLAAGGQQGVRNVLDLLANEITNVLMLCGCPGVTQVERRVVINAPPI